MRKRADQTFKACRRRWLQRTSEVKEAIERARSEDLKKELEGKKKELSRKEPNHFDCLEDCAVYHVMKAYNSTRPAEAHVTSTREWRKVMVRLTNAKRDAKPRRVSPRGPKPSRDASASESSTGSKKRVRAKKYSDKPDGEVPWPASRKTPGAHRIGWHGTGGGDHFCDFPGCRTVNARNGIQPGPAAKKAAKGGAAGAMPSGVAAGAAGSTLFTLPKGFTVRPVVPKAKASRAASPTPSDAISNASQRAGRCKMYCLDCYDASNARQMNFHADCWNAWHALCHEACDDE